MWAYYSTAMSLVALSVAFLLRRFAAPKVSIVSLVATGLAWLTALSVVALVPIDVYSTLAHKEAPAIKTLWSISYWSTQGLTWAVIPMLQQYSLSGAFTIGGRDIGSMVIWPFGLIDLARPGVYTVKHIWVGRAAEKLTDASAELEKVLAIVLATAQQVPRSDTQLRKYVELLMEYADAYSPVKLAAVASGKVSIDRLEEGDLDYATSADMMARLRGRMKSAIANFVGCRSEYMSFVRKALGLEAICKSRQHGVYSPPSGDTGRSALAWWYYKCRVRPWVQQLAALLTAAASAVIVWSEATIATGTSPDLSPFSLMIHSGESKGEFVTQTLVAIPLAYICSCAYFSLFKLGNFGFYHMVTRATWAYSLLLSGSLLCRFAAPLCFNFLHVIRMNEYLDDGEQMVFIQKMKGMNDVPVLGQDFNTWFPLTITIYCGMLFFNLWEKCASRLFISSRFRFDTERADDEHTGRGMRLVQLEQDAMCKGYPLGDGIGLFGVGSSALAPASGSGSRGSGAGATMELNRSVHGSKGNQGGPVVGAGGNASSSSRNGSPPRPAFGAWGPAGHGAGVRVGGNSSSNLASELIKNKYGGSSDSLHAGREGSTSVAATPGPDSRHGSPARQPPPVSQVDDLFAAVEGRRVRGRQGDVQRLVDSSAENSSGGFRAGLNKWRGAWRDQ
ncbi:hypothetical protein N2152v2_005990 [Parachlorella kessleri]